jgi:uncharacterized membrane protein
MAAGLSAIGAATQRFVLCWNRLANKRGVAISGSNTLMKSEETEQQKSTGWKCFFVGRSQRWWLFCLAVVVVKLLLLAIDPSPRLYVVDSLSYVRTAITGWMPEDLCYFYGYFIRWFCNWAGSFTPLIIVQVFLGVIIAVTVAWICRAIFLLSEWLSYLFGFLCSIDPLQLAWERYVMPETFGLFFYALVVHQSFVYLRSRRTAVLVGIQILSVITIGFGMIFLIPLQVMAAALPLIAFAFDTTGTSSVSGIRQGRLQFLQRWTFWRHLAVSLIAMFVLTWGYKQANGLFSDREPAYTYGSGYFLLSVWAPAVRPEDSSDPRLAEIIRHGSEFDLKNETLRNAQRYAPGHLIDRWRRVEPDKLKSGEIATSTALNALRRHPGGVIKVAANTYYAFWRGPAMERLAKADLGTRKISARDERLLVERYHWRGQADTGAVPVTLCRWYYVAAAPYYFAILLSPLLSLALLFTARNKAHAVLLFAHTSLVFVVTFLFSIAPTTRYFQPLSLLLLLSVGLAVKSLYAPVPEDTAAREFSSAASARNMSRRQRFSAAFGLVAVAAILRISLAGNQPLWNDEIFSLAIATGHSLDHSVASANPALGDFVQPDLPVPAEELRRYLKHDNPPAGPGRIVRAVFLSDTSPPLYYLLLYGWTLAFGTSDFVLREFSIICSLACLPLLAGIARRTGGTKAVVPTCLLFAFSPLGITFSTEARMYSLLWLWVLAVTWLSLVWRERGGSMLLQAAWVGTSAAGFLTHYFFVFPWTALILFLLLRPEKVPRTRLLTCLLFTALLISPWYLRLPESRNNWRITQDWLNWEPQGFSSSHAATSLVLQNFSGAGHHESSNFVALVLFGIIGVAMVLRLRLQLFGGCRLLLWLLFAAPCAGLFVFDSVFHTYTVAHGRYAIAALPIACLLAAAGLLSLPTRTRTLLLVLVLLAWAPNLLIYDQTGKRLTARRRAEVVSAEASPSDLILIDAIPSGLLNIVRYLKSTAPVAFWMASWVQEPGTRQRPEKVLEIIAGRTRIWWVAGAGCPPEAPERDWLRAHAVVFHETKIISDFRPKDAATF